MQPPVIEKIPARQPVQKETVTAAGEDKAVTKDDLHVAAAPEPKVRKTDKPAEIKKLPVTVPGAGIDKQAIDDNLISLRDPQSYEAEQFKILRTNLLFPVSGSPNLGAVVKLSALQLALCTLLKKYKQEIFDKGRRMSDEP